MDKINIENNLEKGKPTIYKQAMTHFWYKVLLGCLFYLFFNIVQIKNTTYQVELPMFEV